MPHLFISDLHLTEERPEANERFIAFLEEKARNASALYILGDFFEYWIGDDDLAEPFNAIVAGLLKDLTQEGVTVRLMHGNRDFLIGERFCAATGARLLADPTVEEINDALSGNLCRCTGYTKMVTAIQDVARSRRGATARLPAPGSDGRQ